jgi:hypothetical protein
LRHAHRALPQVCSALGQIAKHSVDLAEVVVEAEVFPKCLTCLKYPDEFVQKHAATLVSVCGVRAHSPSGHQQVCHMTPPAHPCRALQHLCRLQVREVVKHTPELAQLVVANGGVGALVEYCNDSAGNNRCARAGSHGSCKQRTTHMTCACARCDGHARCTPPATAPCTAGCPA